MLKTDVTTFYSQHDINILYMLNINEAFSLQICLYFVYKNLLLTILGFRGGNTQPSSLHSDCAILPVDL